MAGIGFALFLLMLWTGWAALTGRLGTWRIGGQRLLLWAWVAAIPLGYIAVDMGWIVREVGRQPWIIYGLLRTSDGVSYLPVASVGFTAAGFFLLDSLLLAIFVLFACADRPQRTRSHPAGSGARSAPTVSGRSSDGRGRSVSGGARHGQCAPFPDRHLARSSSACSSTFYVVLDGFDLGIGVLSLFVREDERRGIMMASLSSVWDANETWLIVLGGALFGAFPVAYGIILNALYLPVIVMIFAFAFRGVAFEFREHARRRRLWEFAFGLGSLVAALCQGFVLGGLIAGPTVHDGRYAGGPFDWFSPFSVLVAFGVVFGYVLLGRRLSRHQDRRTFAEAWRQYSLDRGRVDAGRRRGRFGLDADPQSPGCRKWFGHGVASAFVIPPIFALFCSGMLARALWRRQEHAPFVWSVGIFLASLIGLAASLYPYLVPAPSRRVKPLRTASPWSS